MDAGNVQKRPLENVSRAMCSSNPRGMLEFGDCHIFMAFQLLQFLLNIQLSIYDHYYMTFGVL